MIWSATFGSLFALMFAGAWLGLALGLTGFLIMQVWGGGVPLFQSVLWSALDVYGLTALPLFLFMGELILSSGISAGIYDSVSPLLARFPGKLLHSNVVACALFAAVFGSSSACVAAVGSVAIPELRKRKYDNSMILGSLCVAGTLGIMIPPSGMFILYGSIASVSIGALFAAGVIPGIMMAALYMAYIAIKGTITPQIAPVGEKIPPFKSSLRPLLGLWPLVILMVACILPIYTGLTTATEAAGIGTLAALVVGSTVGKLRWSGIRESLKRTVRISCMLFFIILGAMILAKAISTLGLPRHLIEWIGTFTIPPMVVLVGIYVLYIILGCFFDGASMLVMTLPFVQPIVTGMGFDMVWIGVLIVLMVEIGQVTPPLGLVLFVVQGVAGAGTTLKDVFMGSIPFLCCTLVVLAIMTVVPGVVSWFPSLLNL